MTAFLQRYSVGHRLSAAFGLLILISGILVAAGWVAMAGAREQLDGIVHSNIRKINLSHGMLDANASILFALGGYATQGGGSDAEKTLALIQAERTHYDQQRDQLFALPIDAAGKRLRGEIQHLQDQARPLNDAVIDAVKAGDHARAQTLFHEKSAPVMLAWQAKIRANVALQNALSKQAYAAAVRHTDRGRAILVGGGIVAVLASSLLAWLIIRSLTQPLRRAIRAAEAIAEGRLDNDVDTQARDEPGRLLNAMCRMQTQLQRFSGEMALMIQLHAGQNISHHMPEDFPGVYGELSKGVNTVIFEHLSSIGDAVKILAEYANGDLRRDARRLPGSRAMLHQTMDTAKASLLAINTEIKRLAAAAAAGDFSARGDAEHFQHDFRLMVQGLNAMMQASDVNLGKLSTLLQAIAAGDLNARMHGEFHGVFASMRDDANATAEQLACIVGRIQTASLSINAAAGEIAAGNDDLSRRTEQQAASLEETAASMEELTSTVKQNAEHARQANQLAVGA
ncbi:chemotaxis protein, partial [Xanthomonas hyacinthi DSM 19077]